MILLFVLFFLFMFDLIFLGLGFLLFYISRLFGFYWLGFAGHRMVALFSAGFFGIFSSWISNHCFCGNCQKCKMWTCNNYHREN